jgi:hypothetical protein
MYISLTRKKVFQNAVTPWLTVVRVDFPAVVQTTALYETANSPVEQALNQFYTTQQLLLRHILEDNLQV